MKFYVNLILPLLTCSLYLSQLGASNVSDWRQVNIKGRFSFSLPAE